MTKTINKKLSLYLAIILLIVCASIVGYFLPTAKKTPSFEHAINTDCQNCNVVLIVIDTLRQDHLGSYGYLRNTTPTLDKVATQSLLFLNNYSASNWTIPSMMSLFTGAYPQHHLVDNKYFRDTTDEIVSLDKTAPHLITMAQYFQEAGYKTAGFTGGAGISSQFGFNKGFDIYSDNVDFAGFESTVPKALFWLKEIAGSDDNKHFLFLHGYDLHGQYAGNDSLAAVFSDSYNGDLTGSTDEHIELRDQHQANGQLFIDKADQQFLIDRYDDKILAMDEKLREFLQSYHQKFEFKNPTIFIITSDHGEEWFDHGGIDHGLTLYQEVVKTPLIIHLPTQVEKVELEKKTSSVDLLPTILELVKIPLAENVNIDGVSFAPNIKGVDSAGEVLFHSNYRQVVSLRGGINQNNEKIFIDLITNQQESYDLNKDSQEQNNLKNQSALDWLKQFFWELNL